MDKQTTAKLDGVVVIDHYITNPLRYRQDIRTLADKSGGRIVIGEIGIPIPNIHLNYTSKQQPDWLTIALGNLRQPIIMGVNYWTNVGGSTALWNEDGSAKLTLQVLAEFYRPK